MEGNRGRCRSKRHWEDQVKEDMQINRLKVKDT